MIGSGGGSVASLIKVWHTSEIRYIGLILHRLGDAHITDRGHAERRLDTSHRIDQIRGDGMWKYAIFRVRWDKQGTDNNIRDLERIPSPD